MNSALEKRILIVDDSEDNRQLLKTLLESRGYTTDCTSNGEEALSLLNSSQKLPQTILLDLRMPVMDGITFRLFQRANFRLKEIPVVIMSAEDEIEKTAFKFDSEVLQKPFNVQNLIDVVERNTKRA